MPKLAVITYSNPLHKDYAFKGDANLIACLLRAAPYYTQLTIQILHQTCEYFFGACLHRSLFQELDAFDIDAIVLGSNVQLCIVALNVGNMTESLERCKDSNFLLLVQA